MIVLLVRVSVVALPTNVSVALGKVSVLLEAPTSATPARVIFAVPLLVPSLKTTVPAAVALLPTITELNALFESARRAELAVNVPAV